MSQTNYDKKNLNPHKEARFAMYHWHDDYARKGLGSMQFYEKYLSDEDRKFCERAIADILKSRDKSPNEK